RTNLANQEFNLGSEAFPFTRLYVKELIGPDGNNVLIPSDPSDPGDPPEIPELTSFEFSDDDSTTAGDANGITYSTSGGMTKLGDIGTNEGDIQGLRVGGESTFAQVTPNGIGLQG